MTPYKYPRPYGRGICLPAGRQVTFCFASGDFVSLHPRPNGRGFRFRVINLAISKGTALQAVISTEITGRSARRPLKLHSQ